jgi:beta-lactamase superfamily II metal-dependent hydrolase
MPRRVPTGFYFLLFVVLLFATVSVYRDIFAPPALTLTVLQSGEGSAALIRVPTGEAYLINTGSDAGILRELGAAMPLFERRIDGVFLTSAVTGATGGLTDVVRRYHVPVLIRSGAEGSRAQEALIDSVTENVPVLSVERGDRIALGGGAYADILWPPKSAKDIKAAEGALVLRLSYGTTSILIQSDLPPRISKWLAATDANFIASALIISSSTPKGAFRLTGTSITTD